ncbi:sarcosine oxidase gamma subunit [Burkholderia lata]|uniref:Sarcosine oxidase gamma subunit n=1 Tax=Burkholderia lata (strain ATCC 17760 / DSM 23089 / LMG 22485 / NCIMB 9086 / R18194 / 383) TaxID=482957 RepID=A0A6P2T5H8_BURL3|nr:sarcosine oxidase subunit gamma family protein [Burkholderia lata]VWC51082.1 sarcosine oxidase gamma subunit [Burkholderia lata]
MAEPDPAIMLRRTAPAAMADVVRAGFSCRLEHGLGIAKLHVFGAEPEARFRAVIGSDAPRAGTQTGTQTSDGELSFAWLAPGEWLLTGSEAAVAASVARLCGLGADDLLAIDVSHARAAFLVEGANSRLALAAHCPLDLWTEVFPVDAVARSLLGDAGMFIARLADAHDVPRFRIIVDQTMAAYAGRLFART